MVQLSLGCKQLSSDVNKIALSLVEIASAEYERRQDATTTTVYEDLNELRKRLSDELWVGNKTYYESKEWLETHFDGMQFRYYDENGSVQKKTLNFKFGNYTRKKEKKSVKKKKRIPVPEFFIDEEEDEEEEVRNGSI